MTDTRDDLDPLPSEPSSHGVAEVLRVDETKYPQVVALKHCVLAVIEPAGAADAERLRTGGKDLAEWIAAHDDAVAILGIDDLLSGEWPQVDGSGLTLGMAPFDHYENGPVESVGLVVVKCDANLGALDTSLRELLVRHPMLRPIAASHYDFLNR